MTNEIYNQMIDNSKKLIASIEELRATDYLDDYQRFIDDEYNIISLAAEIGKLADDLYSNSKTFNN